MSKEEKETETIEMIATGEYTVSKRPVISQEAKFKLWVRSGGRCVIITAKYSH